MEQKYLEYFIAFETLATLSNVAAAFHISQPTITRAMQRLEAQWGVVLFERKKNKMELNQTGHFALGKAKVLLAQMEKVQQEIATYEERQKTLVIANCAAIELPKLATAIALWNPSKEVVWRLSQPEQAKRALDEGDVDLCVLPYPIEAKGYTCKAIEQEQLLFFLPKTHRFATSKRLAMQALDGENMLLFAEIGFWADLVHQKMPHSRFLMQWERFTFSELVTHSSLPSFTSNLVLANSDMGKTERVAIPIEDEEGNVMFYLISRSHEEQTYQGLFDFLAKDRM
ncbi:MAG: LysR family transcriptional regulator [Erysipelotrichaceae bacterium]